MKTFSITLCLIIVLNGIVCGQSGEIISKNENTIIKEAMQAIDSLHNLNNFLIDIEIQTIKGEETEGRMNGICLFKNFDESIIVIKFPKKDTGKALLNKNALFYIYFPSIRKTQPVNPTSKLFGNFNTSDVLKPPFSDNYEPHYIDTRGNTHIIEFTTTNEKMPYQKQILYYDYEIKKARYIELYSKSGKLIKTAYYDEYIEINGITYVSTIRIESVLGQTSIMKFSRFQSRVFPENYFSPSGLIIVAESF
ncbi:MAG: outer membrane lipoprotein-sorting protein [Spirochaetales bacterium]|nr:outer membrane lipoprotein-sorting protein [Spirochaetales bacterium]